MQISKSLSFVCAAAVIIPMSALPADNPAQAKARQALEQAYQSGAAQTAAPAAQPSQPAFPVPAKPAHATSVVQPQPVAQATATPTPADSDAIAKARAAVRAKMASLETGASEAAPANAVSEEKIEQSRAAMRQHMDAVAQREQAAAANQQAAKSAPAPLKGVGQYEPLEGPALPFSAEKQAKLADLLRKYRADEITPEQYHAERAKIISGK